jgi:hypothetical protein
MTTKALFQTALGGASREIGFMEFTRTAADVLTATAHGLQTGAGPFRVMTTNADAPAGLVVAVRANKAYTPSTDIQDETVAIDGKTYTWRDAPGNTDGEVDVAADNAVAAGNLTRAINLGPNAGTDYGRDTVSNPNVRAFNDEAVCTVEAVNLDATAGNAIVIAEAAAGAWAGGATSLSGGIDGTDYFIINLTANTFSVATTKALAIAGTVVSITDTGTGVHRLITTVETLSESLEDVVVNRLTATGVRVLLASQNIADFWQSGIDGVAN